MSEHSDTLLLNGEAIQEEQEIVLFDGYQPDVVINEKYVKGDVRIVTEMARYPLTSIVPMLSGSSYKLNPEFQRRHRWNDPKRSRLIESFIMNVPVPPVFLYEDRFSHYEVMDGLQRLTAIYDFYTDKLQLAGLVEWRELNGRKYSQLPEQVRAGVDRRYLTSIILLHETAKSSAEADRLKQLVFERINSGGVELEPQESRNAVYNGPLNQLCIRLSRNEHLCTLWDIPVPVEGEHADKVPEELLKNETYRTMQDVELVLRFFAYRQKFKLQRRSLRDYLDYYLRHGNGFHPDLLLALEKQFVDTIRYAHDLLGAHSFHLYRKRRIGSEDAWEWLSRPTLAVYDPLMYVLCQLLPKRDALLRHSAAIRDGMKDFYRAQYDIFEGRNVNISVLADREKAFNEFFAQFE
jgi:hypothetical protein